MADLIRTLEADLFGAYEWAAELYEDLVDVPEGPDRLAVYRGLLRAAEGIEAPDKAMGAAEGLVAADEALDEAERALLAPLEAPRDALFEDASAEHARAFLDVFRPAWHKQQALLSDALLAALAASNIIASRGRATLPESEVKALHSEAAQLYEDAYALLGFRVGTGSTLWKETVQSSLFRASAAWRLAGEGERARRAAEIAGPPEGAADLQGRGLKRAR